MIALLHCIGSKVALSHQDLLPSPPHFYPSPPLSFSVSVCSPLLLIYLFLPPLLLSSPPHFSLPPPSPPLLTSSFISSSPLSYSPLLLIYLFFPPLLLIYLFLPPLLLSFPPHISLPPPLLHSSPPLIVMRLRQYPALPELVIIQEILSYSLTTLLIPFLLPLSPTPFSQLLQPASFFCLVSLILLTSHHTHSSP